MATLQPMAEGQGGSPSSKKSFSQLFTLPAVSPVPVRLLTTYKSEATIVFSKEEADTLAAPFRLALIGKFSHGRPMLNDRRKFFTFLNLRN